MATLLLPPETTGAIWGLAIVAVILAAAITSYIREGRNAVLEEIVARHELRLPVLFDGTLAVEEHRTGSFLRLSKTEHAKMLQFKYKWFSVGPQAIFDEVVFDASRRLVTWRKKTKEEARPFSDFRAVHMQEKYGGKNDGSRWDVELIPHKGRKAILVSGEYGYRQSQFEATIPVTRAIAAIMLLPVEVSVIGNVWTPGWPPKSVDAL